LSEKKSSWKGLSHYAKLLLYGSTASSPKIGKGDFGTTNTPTDSENYTSMDKDYPWFRQDELDEDARLSMLVLLLWQQG
jgi:hypothetical protein